MCKIYSLSITEVNVATGIISTMRNNLQNRELPHDISRPLVMKQDWSQVPQDRCEKKRHVVKPTH